ncbi:IMPACT family protein [Glaciimonas soli]|uniref:DUF1949 domain-containing protein n=1 Tax=Glaciimonas soli TaxID=2590999 RepID=A0A843YIR3_9BURK|nr:YigZ family protein [Glaciimonas soli]MQQ99668.1 DUF1949 domain-containing protein [Glaciimonas soli]
MSATLLTLCQYREEIRKSRFLAQAAPISSAEEAQAFISQYSDLTASHNCWAWKCGQQYRFSDAGEPSGTAGRPILAAIETQDWDQCVIVVTRWYGGIQLGTGGLARAYGGSAAKCLQLAERCEIIQRQRVTFHCSFALLPVLKARVMELNALIESETFDAHGAQMILAVPDDVLPALQQMLADLSRGQIQFSKL